MIVGIVGGGIVGRATARCFMEHAEVRVFDVVKERATHSVEDTLDSDLIFICLPTPQKEGKYECDLSAIEWFFEAVAKPTANYVLRSTVPIGTTARLKQKIPNLVHSPEFLTARCSIVDAQVPSRNIIGGYGDVGGNLHELYYKRFPGVPILHMSSDESEMVKLMLNSFFAVKVSFFNEARELADKLELNWDNIRAGVLSDGRVAHSHTQVPGPDGLLGWGGPCISKDSANFVSCIKATGLNPILTEAAIIRNMHDRERKVDVFEN